MATSHSLFRPRRRQSPVASSVDVPSSLIRAIMAAPTRRQRLLANRSATSGLDLRESECPESVGFSPSVLESVVVLDRQHRKFHCRCRWTNQGDGTLWEVVVRIGIVRGFLAVHG